MYVAQITEDVLHLQGVLDDLGDSVPAHPNCADENFAFEALLNSELAKFSPDVRTVPHLARQGEDLQVSSHEDVVIDQSSGVVTLSRAVRPT